MMDSGRGVNLDLEDLGRRYDARVLREYLIEQEMSGALRPDDGRGIIASVLRGDSAGGQGNNGSTLPGRGLEVFELRYRSFFFVRLCLLLCDLSYWSVLGYSAFSYNQQCEEFLASTIVGPSSTTSAW